MAQDVRYNNTAFNAYECSQMTLSEFGSTFGYVFEDSEEDIALVYQQCLDLVAANTPKEQKSQSTKKVKNQVDETPPTPVQKTGGEEEAVTETQS